MDTPGCIINGYLAVLTVCGQTIAAGLVLNVFIDIQTCKELIQMDTDKMVLAYTMSPTLAQTCPGSKDSIINNKIMCSFVIPNVALQMYSTNLHNIPPFF